MNVSPVKTSMAHADDLPAIVSLLAACELPADDLSEAILGNFVVAKSGDDLVGVVGLEVLGTTGLLRSLAVRPKWRGHKLGERLVAEGEARARKEVNALYLLTTTAQAYLQRLEYEDVPRETVPEVIATHAQFRGLCPASAKCLMKRL